MHIPLLANHSTLHLRGKKALAHLIVPQMLVKPAAWSRGRTRRTLTSCASHSNRGRSSANTVSERSLATTWLHFGKQGAVLPAEMTEPGLYHCLKGYYHCYIIAVVSYLFCHLGAAYVSTKKIPHPARFVRVCGATCRVVGTGTGDLRSSSSFGGKRYNYILLSSVPKHICEQRGDHK